MKACLSHFCLGRCLAAEFHLLLELFEYLFEQVGSEGFSHETVLLHRIPVEVTSCTRVSCLHIGIAYK